MPAPSTAFAFPASLPRRDAPGADLACTRDYALPGARLRCHFVDEALAPAVEAALAPYRRDGCAGEEGAYVFFFLPRSHADTLRGALADAPLLHRSELYQGVPFELRGDGGRLAFLTLADRVALFDAEARTVWCCAPPDDPADRLRGLMNTLLVPLLNEVLSRSGRFLLHCGAVADGEAGVLVAASSGGGKTTTVLALAAAGFRFISDDLTILDVSGPTAILRPFVRAVRILPDTLARVPGLERFRARPLVQDKIELRAEELDPAGPCAGAPARLLLFPAEASLPGAPESRPLAAAEALERLVYHGLFITGAHGYGPRMAALIDLVNQAPAAELRRFVPPARLPGLARELRAGPP